MIVTWQFEYKRTDFWSLESSLLWIPSLVCPASSLSSSEVKELSGSRRVSLH